MGSQPSPSSPPTVNDDDNDNDSRPTMMDTSASPSTSSPGPIRRISLPIPRSPATPASFADSMYVDEPLPSSPSGTGDNEITSPTQDDLDGLFDDVLTGYGLYTPTHTQGQADGNRFETATENEVGDIPTQTPRFPVLESTLPSPAVSPSLSPSGTLSGITSRETETELEDDDDDVLVDPESSLSLNCVDASSVKEWEAERIQESPSPTTPATTTTPTSPEPSPTAAAYPPALVQSRPITREYSEPLSQHLSVSTQAPPAQSRVQVPPPIASAAVAPPSQPQQPPQLQTQATQTQGRRRPLPQPPGSGASASGSGSASGPRPSAPGSVVTPGSVASPSSVSMLGSMMSPASSVIGSIAGSPIGTQVTASAAAVGASSVPTVSIQVPPPSTTTTTSDTVIPNSSPPATATTSNTNTTTSTNANPGTTTTTNSPNTTTTTTPRRRPLSQKERDFPQPIVFAPERINPHVLPIPSSPSTNPSMTSQANTIPNNQTDSTAINPNAVLPTHHPQSSLSDMQRNITDLQEEVPTDPGSEFPDHDNAFLPRYIRNVEQDPIASQYLGGGPGPGPVRGADVVMREMNNGEDERYLSYHEASGSANASLGMSLSPETFMSTFLFLIPQSYADIHLFT